MAVIYVLFASKANRICFVFGFISSMIYIYLTFSLKFYFDTSINIYYLIMSIYGWYAWGSDGDNYSSIMTLSSKKFSTLLFSGLIFSLGVAFTATLFTDASLAYLDAFTTVFSIIATWMVVKKYIENWLIWIIVDLVASGMYFYKEFYLTSLLFILYTLIAIYGFFKWRKKLNHV